MESLLRMLEHWVTGLTSTQAILLACMSLVIIALLDYFTSVEYVFAFFYLFPVFVFSWKFGLRGGLAMSVLCAGCWVIIDTLQHPSFASGIVLWNTATQFGVFAAFASSLAAVHSNSLALQETNHDLQAAIDEVKRLSGVLPICAWCKKIRDSEGKWFKLEQYLADHADVDFTHSICPDCLEQYRDELIPVGVRR